MIKTINLASYTVTITSTNVAQAISPVSQQANRLDIQAGKSNAADIFVGASNIKNDGSQGGIDLGAGDVYNIELITDLIPVYVVGTAGDKVTINYWIGDRN